MRFFKDEEGVVMIEYALIAALIGVALIITLIALADELNTIFRYIVTKLQGAQT
jgi:Flp pilus assembly pilin Flp